MLADRVLDGDRDRDAAPRPRDRPPSARTRLRSHRVVQLVGLLVVSTVVAIGGAQSYRANVVEPLDLSAVDTDAQVGRAVRLTCDPIDTGLAIGVDVDDDEMQYLALCPVGDAALAVLSDRRLSDHGELVGTLQAATGEEVWAGHTSAVRMHARTYLDTTTGEENRLVLGLVVALGLGGLVGWAAYLTRAVRDRRRRRREA